MSWSCFRAPACETGGKCIGVNRPASTTNGRLYDRDVFGKDRSSAQRSTAVARGSRKGIVIADLPPAGRLL